MKDFAGKTAVVTGAASGIGLALAERFAAARMRVVLADIEEDALSRAVEQLEARQAEVIGVPVNTMVRESVFELAERAIDAFGKVHVLCNNAGVASASSVSAAIWEQSRSEWDWVLGVNFNGVLYGLEAFVPHMLEHGESGHIVNTASLAALMPGGGTYGVSKHGVLVLTETLYNDLMGRFPKGTPRAHPRPRRTGACGPASPADPTSTRRGVLIRLPNQRRALTLHHDVPCHHADAPRAQLERREARRCGIVPARNDGGVVADRCRAVGEQVPDHLPGGIVEGPLRAAFRDAGVLVGRPVVAGKVRARR